LSSSSVSIGSFSVFSRWFCHFDDDNYVNVPALVEILSGYDVNQDWYLGKTSIPTPMEVVDRRKKNPKVGRRQNVNYTRNTNLFIELCVN
jgi:hypothetical protein